MTSFKEEISQEFDEYSSVSYKDNFSIGQVMGHFGGSRVNIGFGFEKKSSPTNTPYQRYRLDKALLFCKVLMRHGNLDYAIKTCGMGYESALHYINVLNKYAEEHGLPAIFKRKTTWKKLNAKLSEKQVSIIRYLLTKRSTYEVAKMYNISPSACYLIKIGLTWKTVSPAIINHTPVRIVNQYQVVEDSPSFTPINNNEDARSSNPIHKDKVEKGEYAAIQEEHNRIHERYKLDSAQRKEEDELIYAKGSQEKSSNPYTKWLAARSKDTSLINDDIELHKEQTLSERIDGRINKITQSSAIGVLGHLYLIAEISLTKISSFPLLDGGIGFEIRDDKGSCIIDCHNEGEIVLLRRHNDERPFVKKFNTLNEFCAEFPKLI